MNFKHLLAGAFVSSFLTIGVGVNSVWANQSERVGIKIGVLSCDFFRRNPEVRVHYDHPAVIRAFAEELRNTIGDEDYTFFSSPKSEEEEKQMERSYVMVMIACPYF
jgi:hypothetical protein